VEGDVLAIDTHTKPQHWIQWSKTHRPETSLINGICAQGDTSGRRVHRTRQAHRALASRPAAETLAASTPCGVESLFASSGDLVVVFLKADPRRAIVGLPAHKLASSVLHALPTRPDCASATVIEAAMKAADAAIV
jgi:hypothetical protein